MASKKELKQKIEELEADYKTMEEVAAYLASDCKELYEDNVKLEEELLEQRIETLGFAHAYDYQEMLIEKAKREAQFWKRVATRVE